jgi:O-succinylbenzoate synthase
MAVHPPFLYWMDVVIEWMIYSFQLPLISGNFRNGLILRLVDHLGRERWGEIAPLPGRSKETIEQALDQLLKIFAEGKMDKELLPSVQFGIECALAFPSPAVTAPLYTFLHGTSDEILQRAEAAYTKGYTVAKVKISSFKVGSAIDLLDALKNRFRLRVDCNRAFSFEEANVLFSHFDPNHFDYVEDPTFEISRLADFRFPFALDETVSDCFSLPIQTYSHLYGFILKPTILGGKKGCAPFIQFAKKHQLKVVFSPAFESGLGLLQILSVAKHFDLLSDPLGLDTHRYLAHDLLFPSVNFDAPKIILNNPPEINTCLLQEIAHGKWIHKLPNF